MRFLIRLNVLDHISIQKHKVTISVTHRTNKITTCGTHSRIICGENDEPVARFGVAVTAADIHVSNIHHVSTNDKLH